VVSNYGYVQVRQDEGSPKFLNDYSPERNQYGGGIGDLTDGQTQINTFYPGNAGTFEQVFGIGYLRKKVTGKTYCVDQVIFAPFGDDPLLVSQVTVSNRRASEVELRWVEYWGCQVYRFSFRSYMEASVHGDEKRVPELRRDFGDRFAHHFRAMDGNLGLFESKRFLGRTAEEEEAWKETQSRLSAKSDGWLEYVPEGPVKEISRRTLLPQRRSWFPLVLRQTGSPPTGRLFSAPGA